MAVDESMYIKEEFLAMIDEERRTAEDFLKTSDELKYTADEFLELSDRRWCELIDGYIVDMFPEPWVIRNILHNDIILNFGRDLLNYIDSQKENCKACINSNVMLSKNTVVMPDIFVACDKSKFDKIKFKGAPDWIVEVVSPANFLNDYYAKLDIYKNCGVREYWIVDPRKKLVTVHVWDSDCKALDFYHFSDKIPVHIFKDKIPPLEICIADYTESLEN